jgi:hypothetical protein
VRRQIISSGCLDNYTSLTLCQRIINCRTSSNEERLGRPLQESLPPKILELEHLKTLDLRGTMLTELPVFKSSNLVSLVDGIKLTEGLGELSAVRVGMDCYMLVKVVQESKRLRRLGVTISYDASVSAQGRKVLTDLLGAIGNSNILPLCLDDWSGDGSVLLDSPLSCWAIQRPRHLQKLLLQLGTVWLLPEVPRKMSPSLLDLTHLNITVRD